MAASQPPLKSCKNCGRNFMNPQDFLKDTSRWRICDEGHLWFNCNCKSTCMILKGRYPWYNPTARLSPEAQSVFNRLPQMKELPHISTFVMEVQVLLENENTSSQQLAKVAKRDPLLAAQILNVANQQAHGTHIESLAHAISYVGLEPFKDFILLAAVSSLKLETTRFQAEKFWEHSFLVGRCAEFLNQRFKLPFTTDHVYIAGSACNIGKIVMALCMPELADRYQKDMDNLKILGSWSQAEHRHGAYQHTVLGEIGAMFWGLPESIGDAIALHHRPPTNNRGTQAGLHELIGLANQISHWVALQPHQMDQKLFAAYCGRFGLTTTQAEKMIEEMLSLRAVA